MANTDELNERLIAAADEGNLDEVKALLEQGADVNGVGGSYGYPALWFAAYNDNTEMIKVLVEAGAKVEISCKHDWTPFMLAVDNANIEVMQLLADAGADVNACSEGGETPLYLAVRGGQNEIVDFLLEHEASCEICLASAVFQNDAEVASFALNQGASPDGEDFFGTPLLLAAVEKCNAEIVQMLLNAGAQIDVEGDDGTALEMAEDVGNDEIVDILKSFGATK